MRGEVQTTHTCSEVRKQWAAIGMEETEAELGSVKVEMRTVGQAKPVRLGV